MYSPRFRSGFVAATYLGFRFTMVFVNIEDVALFGMYMGNLFEVDLQSIIYSPDKSPPFGRLVSLGLNR